MSNDKLGVFERIISPTPKFHKRNRNFFGFAAIAAACVLSVASAGVAVPVAVLTAAKVVAAVGATVAGYAQTTVEEPK